MVRLKEMEDLKFISSNLPPSCLKYYSCLCNSRFVNCGYKKLTGRREYKRVETPID
jgi:hypothetical protein